MADYQEGDVAVNKATGQRLIMRGGSWEDYSQPAAPPVSEEAGLGSNLKEVGTDIAKTALPSLARGIVGLATAPNTVTGMLGQGADWAANSLLPEKALGPYEKAKDTVLGALNKSHFRFLTDPKYGYQNVKEGVEENVTGPLYEAQTTPGKFAQAGIEAAPAALAGPGLLSGGKAIIGSLMRGVAGGMGGEAGGQLAEGTALETPARIAGTMLAGSGKNVAKRVATPFPVHPDDLAQNRTVEKALEGTGGKLSAGQFTGNKRLLQAEAKAMEESNAPEWIKPETRMRATNQALAREAGINTDSGMAKTFDQQQKDLGKEYDKIFNSRTHMKLPPKFFNDLQGVADKYVTQAPNLDRNPQIEKIFTDVVDDLINGHVVKKGIPAAIYQKIRTSLSEKEFNAPDNVKGTKYGEAIGSLKGVLDDAMRRSLPKTKRELLDDVNKKYSANKTLEKVSEKATNKSISGELDPKAVYAHAVPGSNLEQVAKALAARYKPHPKAPEESGLLRAALGSTLGHVYGALMGSNPEPITGGILGHMVADNVKKAVSPVYRRVLLSDKVQNHLKNQKFQPSQSSVTDPYLIHRVLLGNPNNSKTSE